jgi:hypothetical protein
LVFSSYLNIALASYLSTPLFVKKLTELSEEIITVANRDDYLKEELKKINNILPAAVYLPFVSSKSFVNSLNNSL